MLKRRLMKRCNSDEVHFREYAIDELQFVQLAGLSSYPLCNILNHEHLFLVDTN